jgi:hypothetical protein
MNPINEIVVTYVTNALWMTCVIAAVTMFLSRALRRGPSSHRHALCVAGLLLAVLLPFASLRGSRNYDKPGPSLLQQRARFSRQKRVLGTPPPGHSGGE